MLVLCVRVSGVRRGGLVLGCHLVFGRLSLLVPWCQIQRYSRSHGGWDFMSSVQEIDSLASKVVGVTSEFFVK